MIFDDWKRYKIRYPYATMPFPLLLLTTKWPHLWSLSEPVVFSWTWDLGNVRLALSKRYQCDGASIPFCFYDVVDPIGMIVAAFLHDLLYETQTGLRKYSCLGETIQLVDDLTGRRIPFEGPEEDPDRPDHSERRARADALLRAFAINSGLAEISAHRAYVGCRVGGRGAWEDEEPMPVSKPLNTVLAEANIRPDLSTMMA